MYWFRNYVNSADETNGHDSACAKLTDDIDLSGDNAFESIGNKRPYKGVFDGNGKTIKSLCYDKMSCSCKYFGLIAEAADAVVKDLCFENVYISAAVQEYGVQAGVVAAYAEDSEFDNIVVKSGSVYLYTNNLGIGGIVGVAYGSHIKNCANHITIRSTNGNIGGICGEISSYNGESTTIENCINDGLIISNKEDNNIGGIVGYVGADLKISNVFNNGSINVPWSSYTTAGNNSVGLIIGGIGDRRDVYANGIVAYNKDCPIKWEQRSTETIKLTDPTGIGYNKEPNSGSVTGFDTELLKSGILAYLLQEGAAKNTWGQNLGKDTVPMFGSTATVYPNGDVKRTCQWALTGEFTNDASKKGTLTVTHEHVTHHDAVAATCTTDGTREYFECDDCHRKFSDEAMTEEILTDIVIPAAHKDPIFHEAKDATCTEDGNVAYYECSSCHHNFSDETMIEEIEGDVVIPAKGHTPDANGVCQVCGEKAFETLHVGKNTIEIKAHDEFGYEGWEYYIGNIYVFMAPADGFIHISAQNEKRICGALYDSNRNIIFGKTDIQKDEIEEHLEKGKLYYIGVNSYFTDVAIPNCEVTIKFNSDSLTFTDKENCDITESSYHRYIFYNRTFNNTNWQPLYVPFPMKSSDWTSQGLEVACIDNFHEYNFGEEKKVVLEVTKVTEGKLHPNTPYLIKSDEVGDKTITLKSTTIVPTENNTFTCSSMTHDYNFIGTYSAKSDFVDTDLIVSGGKLMGISEGAELSAQRWYINITDRDALIGKEPSAAQAPRSIDIEVTGEGSVTGIEHVGVIGNAENSTATKGIYDLQGRKLNGIPGKGVFIVNGKKYVK